MNYYINLVNDAIEYIEANRTRSIHLEDFTRRYAISKYHFTRVFQAVTNRPLKVYLDERRLSEAARLLHDTQRSVIDIAFDLDYESHEAFSRRFRQLYGMSPSDYRKTGSASTRFEKLHIVSRDFKNLKNNLVVKHELIDISDTLMVGKRTHFDSTSAKSLETLNQFVTHFVADFVDEFVDHLYNVTIDADDDTAVQYFTGFQLHSEAVDTRLTRFIIPASQYGVFTYQGAMRVAFGTVFDDVCRFIVATGLHFNKVGIEAFELYSKTYFEDHTFQIYVPIK